MRVRRCRIYHAGEGWGGIGVGYGSGVRVQGLGFRGLGFRVRTRGLDSSGFWAGTAQELSTKSLEVFHLRYM